MCPRLFKKLIIKPHGMIIEVINPSIFLYPAQREMKFAALSRDSGLFVFNILLILILESTL